MMNSRLQSYEENRRIDKLRTLQKILETWAMVPMLKAVRAMKEQSGKAAMAAAETVAEDDLPLTSIAMAHSTEVESWLRSINVRYVVYAPMLLSEGFDEVVTCLALQEADLRELGIPKGHARMILRCVSGLWTLVY